MGLCTSIAQKKPRRVLPLVFQEEVGREKLGTPIEHEFQFELCNVMVLSLFNKDFRVCFSVGEVMSATLSKENVSISEITSSAQEEGGPRLYQIRWKQTQRVHFTATNHELYSQFLTVSLQRANRTTEILKINLYLIVHGPYHHNIQLDLERDSLRLLFDAKISHIFETSIEVKEFSLKTYELPSLPQAHFTVRESIDQMTVIESGPSYNILLPHSNLYLSQETGSYFQEERPNVKRPKKNTSFVNLEENELEKRLIWKPIADGVMPTLTVDISIQEIVHHSLQFLVWGSTENDEKASYIFEAKIPLWKILEKKSAEKNLKVESQEGPSNVQIDVRTIRLVEKLYSHHNIVGTCEILLHMKNEKMIEQLKYCTRTEDGVVNTAPHALNKDIKSNSKMLHELWKAINEVEEKLNVNETFVIHEKMTTIHQKVVQFKSEIYNDPSKVEHLISNQNILLAIVDKLVPFIENNENPTLNSLSWDIIYNIFEKNEFALENLYLKGVYVTSEAQHILLKKKDVCRKYHTILNKLIKFALKTYVALSSMSEGYLKFLTLCFFRVKVFRDEFFEVMDEKHKDDEIQRRLAEYQREIEPKTSFHDNFFKMKTNWDELLYKELEHEAEFKKDEEELKASLKNKKWFMEIGFRDELFYSFCSQFFDKLKLMSLGGAEKWKYIEGYSEMVILIISQMKNKQAIDLSSGLIKASISMLSNEYLINLLIPLICEKTSLHDFSNVQIVLDLIHEYLNYLTKNKTQPLSTTFNQNYFFSLMRIIIEGEHFYSINRILIIIYDYFMLLSEHGRYQISMFLLGASFFKLYYHWSKDIRYTFYNILLIRIQYIKHRKSGEILSKLNKALDFIAIIERLYEKRVKGTATIEQNLVTKMRMKLYQKRKNPIQSTTINSRNEFELDHLERLWQEEYEGLQGRIRTANDLENISEERAQLECFKSEEYLGVIVTPEKKRRTYSENLLPFQDTLQLRPNSAKEDNDMQELNLLKRSVSTYNPDSKTEEKGRRKRKPSLFLSSVTENTKQYTSIITNQLHHFSELTNEELKNVLRAKVQFRELSDEIAKYIAKYSTYPERDFSQTNRKQMQG